MMSESIFEGVVVNENSFTELFRNFLRFKVFRDAFVDLIGLEVDKEKLSYDDFDTQLPLSKFGRPDLVLINDEVEVLFEIKVWNTALTPNQPEGYYKYLIERPKTRRKALILVVPDDYQGLDGYHLRLKAARAGKDRIYTQVIHWQEVVHIFKSQELEALSPLFQEYASFLRNWFLTIPVTFDPLNVSTMFDRHFAESLEKTLQFIENVNTALQKQEYEVKMTRDKYLDFYGIYFTLPTDKEELYFGLWMEYWKDSGNPLSISFYSEDKKRTVLFEKMLRGLNLNPSSEFQEYKVAFIDKGAWTRSNVEEVVLRALISIAEGLGVKKLKSKAGNKVRVKRS